MTERRLSKKIKGRDIAQECLLVSRDTSQDKDDADELEKDGLSRSQINNSAIPTLGEPK